MSPWLQYDWGVGNLPAQTRDVKDGGELHTEDGWIGVELVEVEEVTEVLEEL